MGTPCRGGTGGPSRGSTGRGGEGRGIFLEVGNELGVTVTGGGRGGEEEAVEAELMGGAEEVVEGKKAWGSRSQRERP